MINNPANKPEIPKIEAAKPDAAIVGSIALSSETLRTSVVEEYMPGFKGEAYEALSVLDNKATFIIDAEITGAWHYSPDRIEKFSREGAEASEGNFGTGTYFGIGELTGETVDYLKSGNNIKHEICFSGNILVVDRNKVVDASHELKKKQGQAVSRLRMPIAPIVDQAKGVDLNGQPIHAVMIYVSPERVSGELIVLPNATEGISLLS
ncbi:MAG TPA: hypothetical protein VFZ58_03750 [Candidatus Saccharimonadales bacterium]